MKYKEIDLKSNMDRFIEAQDCCKFIQFSI